MGQLKPYLRSLRSKPRSFHVILLLVLAWVPLLVYVAGHPLIATVLLLVLAAGFLTIHPMTLVMQDPPASAKRSPAANDE